MVRVGGEGPSAPCVAKVARSTAHPLALRLPHPPPPSGPRAEFRRDLAKSEDKCRKVKNAITNVERNRVKFAHIDDRELASRKAFVNGLDQAVIAMHEAFHGRETQAKLDGDRKREMLSRQEHEVTSAGQRANAYNMANRDFINDQSQQQATIRREQDQSLDKMSACRRRRRAPPLRRGWDPAAAADIARTTAAGPRAHPHLAPAGNSLDRLGDMARAIDTELKEQDVIIEDIVRRGLREEEEEAGVTRTPARRVSCVLLRPIAHVLRPTRPPPTRRPQDRDVDVAQGKMDAAIKGVSKLLKTKDRCQLATIAALVVIFVIVAIVAIS